MEQQAPILQKNSTNYPPETRKIKPLICRHPKENSLNPEKMRKSLIMNIKTSRAVVHSPSFYDCSTSQGVKTLMKILKTQISPSGFYHPHRDRFSYFDTTYLYSKLKSVSSLSSLRLHVSDLSCSETSFRALTKSLTSLKNLTHIEIEFLFFQPKSPKIIHKLGHLFLQLTKLSSLSLKFYLSKTFGEIELKILSTYLKRLTKLHTFQLDLGKERGLNDRGPMNLVPVLPHLIHVSKLTLNLSGGTAIEGSPLLQLFNLIQKMKALSDLTLDLSSRKFIDRQGAESFAEGLARLESSSIQKLKISPPEILNDKILNGISQVLKRFTSLSVFGLNLSGCEGITGEWIYQLSSALRSCLWLPSLSLEFPLSITTELIVRYTAFALKPLQNLVYLKLNFSSKKSTTDEQVKHFSSSLQALTQLQFLDLNFSYHRLISDSSLESLGDALKKLVLLKTLSLNFDDNRIITNQGVKTLCQAIPELPCLFFWGLSVYCNEQIDEGAVDIILETVQLMKSLDSLHLGLRNCSKLYRKEDTMKNLFDAIKSMNHIREGSLVLNRLDFILKEAINLKKRKGFVVSYI